MDNTSLNNKQLVMEATIGQIAQQRQYIPPGCSSNAGLPPFHLFPKPFDTSARQVAGDKPTFGHWYLLNGEKFEWYYYFFAKCHDNVKAKNRSSKNAAPPIPTTTPPPQPPSNAPPSIPSKASGLPSFKQFRSKPSSNPQAPPPLKPLSLASRFPPTKRPAEVIDLEVQTDSQPPLKSARTDTHPQREDLRHLPQRSVEDKLNALARCCSKLKTDMQELQTRNLALSLSLAEQIKFNEKLTDSFHQLQNRVRDLEFTQATTYQSPPHPPPDSSEYLSPPPSQKRLNNDTEVDLVHTQHQVDLNLTPPPSPRDSRPSSPLYREPHSPDLLTDIPQTPPREDTFSQLIK